MHPRTAGNRDAVGGARLEEQRVGGQELVLRNDLVAEADDQALEELSRLGHRF